MARDLVAGSKYVSGTCPVTTLPVTISVWVKITSTPIGGSNRFTIFTGYNNTTNCYGLCVTSILKLLAYKQNTSLVSSTSPASSLVSGGWVHCAGIITSTNLITYTGGSSKVTTANSTNNPTSCSSFFIGKDETATLADSGSATLADVAVWNVQLTDAEIAALAAGVKAYSVRPGSLKGLWPLYGLYSPEPDYSGLKHNGTLTGSPTADNHPPVDGLVQLVSLAPLIEVIIPGGGGGSHNSLLLTGVG